MKNLEHERKDIGEVGACLEKISKEKREDLCRGIQIAGIILGERSDNEKNTQEKAG